MQPKTKILLAILSTAILCLFAYQNSGYSLETRNQKLFEAWKGQFGFKFEGAQDIYRKSVFMANLEKVETHNAKLSKGFQMGMNQFGALTEQQFKAQYLSSFVPNSNTEPEIILDDQVSLTGPVVDWVAYGAVSPVKTQGNCQATYAFSAIGGVEGVSAINFRNQTEFSVQQLIDCSSSYGNSGCATGNMINSFKYIINAGIATNPNYPYVGYQKNCNLTNNTAHFIQRYFTLNSNDCVGLANALSGRPISVAVDGNNFQFYRSGIFSNCGSNLSLAVLLVGMTDNYWSLKNSWGTTWGQSGYIRISRGNTCGVCNAACYPSI